MDSKNSEINSTNSTQESIIQLQLDKTLKANKLTQAIFPYQSKLLQIVFSWKLIGNLEIDTSCIMLDDKKPVPNIKHLVDFFNLRAPGVHKSQNNLFNSYEHKLEIMKINLLEIPKSVDSLFICANIYTKGGNFSQISKIYITILDEQRNHNIIYYPLLKVFHTQEIVFCKIFRNKDSLWTFQAIGKGCNGKRANQNGAIEAVRGLREFICEDYIGDCKFENKLNERNEKEFMSENCSTGLKVCNLI